MPKRNIINDMKNIFNLFQLNSLEKQEKNMNHKKQ